MTQNTNYSLVEVIEASRRRSDVAFKIGHFLQLFADDLQMRRERGNDTLPIEEPGSRAGGLFPPREPPPSTLQ